MADRSRTKGCLKWFLCVSCVVETSTVGLFMAERAGDAARRRWERRSRCHWGHEQLSVRLAVAIALHHPVQRHPNLAVSTLTLDECARHVEQSVGSPMLEKCRGGVAAMSCTYRSETIDRASMSRCLRFSRSRLSLSWCRRLWKILPLSASRSAKTKGASMCQCNR